MAKEFYIRFHVPMLQETNVMYKIFHKCIKNAIHTIHVAGLKIQQYKSKIW